MKRKSPVPAFLLVGGPQNVPLMLEQAGVRYATLFTTESSVNRFQQACCSMESYQLQTLATVAEIQSALQSTRKLGCSLLLVGPPGPEINQKQSQTLAGFLRQLAAGAPA